MWDRAATLDSEVNNQVLTLPTERMEESGLVEWPQVRRQDEKKYIGRNTLQRWRQGAD